MAKNNFGIICQSCGTEAPVRPVDFHQNIGMLVMRRSRRINANLCKKCIHKHFWEMTATTLFLGPWGMISAVLAPCFIINNIVWYVSRLGLPPVPAGATKPVLTPEAATKLKPYTSDLITRLNAKESLDTIAPDIAAKAGVTPGQVVVYYFALARQNRPQPVASASPLQRGFPVVPLATQAAAVPATIPPPDFSTPVRPPMPPPPLPSIAEPAKPPEKSDELGIV